MNSIILINFRLNKKILEYCVQVMKNYTHLHVRKVKFYLLFILNKILLKIIIIHF